MRRTQLLLLLLIPFISAADNSVAPLKTGLSETEAAAASKGCISCHTKTDAPTMHSNNAIQLGCTNCHGGDPTVLADKLESNTDAYNTAKALAHIQPKYPENWPSAANPKLGYTNLLKESYEFVKFVNPGDLRVARETCGGCHASIVHAVERSLMTTSAMFWEGASYNNGILPFKKGILGESYDSEGRAREILEGGTLTVEDLTRGAIQRLSPLPQWEVTKPGDIFRVFERGGKFIKSQFAETGIPNPEEDPGRPDMKASNRGPGTGARISVPVLNLHKTRLNDPHLSMMGTNDHPGDYRSSGCTSCHSIYANDRDPKHSGPYAQYGNEGKSISSDPTVNKNEEGHPLRHIFSSAIPTSQCMVCHMHQPNMFVNSFLGYTMWDYEADAPFMWPKEQRDPTDKEKFKIQEHNPEEAAQRGLWSDDQFLKNVINLNSKLHDTQFADYHGHGWNFRAVYKRDRKGNLLDADGKKVDNADPEKFKKAVHLSDIHLDKGMHCVDCHFGQDAHGDGHMYGEVAQAVEIQCQDCHGSIKERAKLKTSGPAAATTGGKDLSLLRTPFGDPLFSWRGGKLFQHSQVTAGVEWKVKQVKDTVEKGNSDYNEKAARAKLIKKFNGGSLAHADNNMACFTCHSSWVTSCAGCHLPIQANWKKTSDRYDGKESRNWASYNPQVARDDMFQLGKHGPAKDGKIVPVRSSSALVLSSTDSSRQKIYVQQPPISSSGYSSQAFAPHFPHTVRTKETKQCADCHVSEANDNNAIMAQLLLLGTNFVNFMGYHAYIAEGEGGLEAVQVTEWDEPQAVIGSYLHRYAYPRYFAEHTARNGELESAHHHDSEGGAVNAIQLRGEYLYTTAGKGGFRVYDAASVANKGFSERIVTAPVSPLGQDTYVATANATSFTLPTTMPVSPERKQLPENKEQPMHAIYNYAFITDSEEGLIAVNIDTLTDGDPTNNFLKRAATWNKDGILNGAKSITLAGARAYVSTPQNIVILDLDEPLAPKLITTVPYNDPRKVIVQFRYAFIVDQEGFHVLDVTDIAHPRKAAESDIQLSDARSLSVARTYAYVAAGKDGLVIIDVEKPESARVYTKYNEDGTINDLNDVKIASTNASLFAYLADGKNGLKVLQLTDPERVPGFYGFSPEVKPKLIAWRKTEAPALAISQALDRDRAVDETGHQVSVFGRLGSRPFTEEEMRRMYIKPNGELYKVKN
jgi:hypothetical protein